MLKGTYTYVTLDVSEATFLEIKSKLQLAGYGHTFSAQDGKALIGMNGLALQMHKGMSEGQAKYRRLALKKMLADGRINQRDYDASTKSLDGDSHAA